LAAVESKRGEDFHKLKSTEVIDVLNGIIEEKRVPRRPRASKMHR
jgi:hypothetical protein